ncbi:hypothetical protein IPM65_06055 [Candidatus Roizmanbacteria bacterium]|nr:MAG: hypothetical protein IPM65_06055 [Candidatus Roizmanbacteria bacterium]
MKFVVRFFDKMWNRDKTETKREAKTKQFAKEVTQKYQKTLRRLSYE